jgi:hypothetical protein
MKGAKTVEIKLVVGEREVQLGWEAVESLIGNLPDEDKSLADLFHDLAQSEAAPIRAAVAGKSVISEETVARLASDPNPEVIRALVNAQCPKLKELALTQIIQRNLTSVNRDIAQMVESYDENDVTTIGKLLASSPDPSVRSSLAGNPCAPKIIVRQLLQDPDREVRRKALETLRRER